jgi:hypothetical protein
MRPDFLKKLVIPFGPLFSLILMGLMLTGALLYSQAVRFQRFIEPSLAVFQPRNTVTRNIGRLLLTEFSGEELNGIMFMGDSILVKGSLLTSGVHIPDRPPVLKKLARVFLSALRDPEISPYIDIILVSAKVPVSPVPGINKTRRQEMRNRAGLVLNSLYREEPELERDYSLRFAAAVMSTSANEEAEWVEFRLVLSELVHVKVLQRLEKYMH